MPYCGRQSAAPRFVGRSLGQVTSADGKPINVEISLEAGPGVLYDAVLIVDGKDAAAELAKDGPAVDFVKDQYRHGKPLLALGAGSALLQKADILLQFAGGSPDRGVIVAAAMDDKVLAQFKLGLAGPRVLERENDPHGV